MARSPRFNRRRIGFGREDLRRKVHARYYLHHQPGRFIYLQRHFFDTGPPAGDRRFVGTKFVGSGPYCFCGYWSIVVTARFYQRAALGTSCSFVVRLDEEGPGRYFDQMVDEFNRMIDELDLAASRFRLDSEVSRLAANDGMAMVVSDLLYDEISQAIRASTITKGYLDPTLGQTISGLGYSKDFELVKVENQDDQKLRVVMPSGYKSVVLDSATRSVKVPSGVLLDLGATAKPHLADRIRDCIEGTYEVDVLVNLGGDISCFSADQANPWYINVTDDQSLNIDSPGEILGFSTGGVATSSIRKRSWSKGGALQHHIVDPYTGRSAVGEIEAVTVLAGSALDANIASTATIAMGSFGFAWLESTRLPAMVKLRDGGSRVLGNWPKRRDTQGVSI